MSQEYEFVTNTENENENGEYVDPELIDDNTRLLEYVDEGYELENREETLEVIDTPDPTHYGLPDGRFWSVADAQFVTIEDPNILGEDIYLVYLQADPEDEENPRTAEQILVDMLKQKDLPLGQFTPVIYLESKVKQERNNRLAATDYLLMPDYTLTDAQRTKLEVYRQALRDLPSQPGFPWDGGGSATPWPILDI